MTTSYSMEEEGDMGGGEYRHQSNETCNNFFSDKDNENSILNNKSKQFKVERDKTCPMYLRLFTRSYEFHSISSFSSLNDLPIEDELVIYTWPDATLKELASLIKDVHPDTRRKGCSFAFRLIFQEPIRGQFQFKDIGIVYNDITKRSKDDFISLKRIRFVQGDYIDVAIYDTDNALTGLFKSSR